MHTELANILAELNDLARRRGLDKVAERVDELLAERAATILVAAVHGTATDLFCSCVRQLAPAASTRAVALEPLRHDPTLTLSADRMIAVFPCGSVPDTDALEAVAAAVFARPTGSYAIVLVADERLASAGDLEAVERFAWRLLVAEPKADWDGQRLADHGIFLWGTPAEGGFLTQRLQSDRVALTRWLAAPIASDLDCYRIGSILALATAEVGQCIPPEDLATESPPFALQETLIELRRQLLARATADTAALEKTLLVGLHTLRRDLCDNLRTHLARPGVPRGAGAPLLTVPEVIESYVAAGLRDWQRNADAAVVDWCRTTEVEWRSCMERIDWDTVNRHAAGAGQRADYPEAFFHQLARWCNASAGASERPLDQASVSAAGPHPSGGGTPFLGAVLAGGVLPALAFLAGAGPIVAITAGVGGATAAHLYERQARSNRRLQECEELGRETIRATVDRAEHTVREEVAARRARVRQALQEEFDTLERFVAVGAAPADPLESSRSDLLALEALQMRLRSAS